MLRILGILLLFLHIQHCEQSYSAEAFLQLAASTNRKCRGMQGEADPGDPGSAQSIRTLRKMDLGAAYRKPLPDTCLRDGPIVWLRLRGGGKPEKKKSRQITAQDPTFGETKGKDSADSSCALPKAGVKKSRGKCSSQLQQDGSILVSMKKKNRGTVEVAPDKGNKSMTKKASPIPQTDKKEFRTVCSE
jgi:hypothetical protein